MPPLAILDSRPWTSGELRQRLIHPIRSSLPPKEPMKKRKTLQELAENKKAKDTAVKNDKISKDSVTDAPEGS